RLLRELIRFAVDLRLRAVAGLDAKQYVVQGSGIARPRVEPDEVISERRQHRLRDLARLQRIDRLLELRHEATLRSLAQVAAVDAGDGISGLALRHILELGAAHDLVAERKEAIAHHGAVGS